ncbi:hypothetical protein CEUSTIGMA_g12582.t1 [Chlamydomonas eustigma]|uniref:Uncharacterized protein n=1 Tax=Chlamydomonas eustigma TaxID=1157962 RepID=A0A250XQ03_9CHLO|nr:hypothetical protein CEUSTIGMA_g12582.t1 [Chlamydomonas eustigma]|eukprot:GAX85164.1 hypothetical protein CEUSTIGMA_g12582.t1 [Chlamydomonas eustigma]
MTLAGSGDNPTAKLRMALEKAKQEVNKIQQILQAKNTLSAISCCKSKVDCGRLTDQLSLLVHNDNQQETHVVILEAVHDQLPSIKTSTTDEAVNRRNAALHATSTCNPLNAPITDFFSNFSNELFLTDADTNRPIIESCAQQHLIVESVNIQSSSAMFQGQPHNAWSRPIAQPAGLPLAGQIMTCSSSLPERQIVIPLYTPVEEGLYNKAVYVDTLDNDCEPEQCASPVYVTDKGYCKDCITSSDVPKRKGGDQDSKKQRQGRASLTTNYLTAPPSVTTTLNSTMSTRNSVSIPQPQRQPSSSANSAPSRGLGASLRSSLDSASAAVKKFAHSGVSCVAGPTQSSGRQGMQSVSGCINGHTTQQRSQQTALPHGKQVILSSTGGGRGGAPAITATTLRSSSLMNSFPSGGLLPDNSNPSGGVTAMIKPVIGKSGPPPAAMSSKVAAGFSSASGGAHIVGQNPHTSQPAGRSGATGIRATPR